MTSRLYLLTRTTKDGSAPLEGEGAIETSDVVNTETSQAAQRIATYLNMTTPFYVYTEGPHSMVLVGDRRLIEKKRSYDLATASTRVHAKPTEQPPSLPGSEATPSLASEEAKRDKEKKEGAHAKGGRHHSEDVPYEGEQVRKLKNRIWVLQQMQRRAESAYSGQIHTQVAPTQSTPQPARRLPDESEN